MARRDRKKPRRRERRRKARIVPEAPIPSDEGIKVYRDETEVWPDDEVGAAESGVVPAPSGLELPAIPAFAALRGDASQESDHEPEEVSGEAFEAAVSAEEAEVEEIVEVPWVFGGLGVASSADSDTSEAATSAKLRAVPDPQESAEESTMIPPEPGEPEEYLSVESAAPILEQLPVPESGHESQSLEELAESAGAHWRDRPEDWEAESQAWEEITAEWKRIDEEEASLEAAEQEEAGAQESAEINEDLPLSQRETQPLPAVSNEPDSAELSLVDGPKRGEATLGNLEPDSSAAIGADEVGSTDETDLPGAPTEAMVLPSDFLGSGATESVGVDEDATDLSPSPIPPLPVTDPVPEKRGLRRLFGRKSADTVESAASGKSVAAQGIAQGPGKAFELESAIDEAGGATVESVVVEPVGETHDSQGVVSGGEYESLPGMPAPVDVTLMESAGDEIEPSLGTPAGEETVVEPLPGEPAKKRNDLVAIATGLIFAVVAIGTIIAGPGYFALLVVALAVAAQIEFFTVVRHAGFQPAPVLSLIGGIAMIWGGATQGAIAVLFALFMTMLAAYLWYYFGVIKTSPVANASVTILGATYLGFLPAIATLIVGAPTPNPAWRALIIFLIAVTVASDVGGYAFGSLLGKHKIASSISPKKSVEGYAGGFLLSLVVAAAFGVAGRFLKNSFSYWHLTNAIVAGVVVAIAASLGDLIESMLKRSLDVKDMGSILPGHGGILDRMDSLLISTPAFFGYLYVTALIQS